MRGSLLLAALLLATAVRLAALPLPGTEDLGVWKIWSYAGSHDVLGVYGIGGDPPERRLLEYHRTYTTVDYPPAALYVMAIVGTIYGRVFPGFVNDWRLNVAVKLPGLLAGLALLAVLYVGVLRLTGSVPQARWVAAAYWCNPATILNGEVLGYLDPLVMAPAVAALLALHLGAPVWAGGLYALALLTKPQALLIGIAFVLAAWHSGGWARVFISGWAASAWLVVGLLPYLLVGAGPNMLRAFGSWQARRDILSGNAANLWWIVTWLARAWNMIPLLGVPGAYLERVHRILAISSWSEMGLPNPRPIGQGFVAGGVLWAVWRTWRSTRPAVHFALGAFTTQVFFTLGVSVHEHHLMMAVPLLSVAAALDGRFRPIFYAVSAIAALNMNVFYGIGRGWGWSVPRSVTGLDFSVVLALTSIVALVWHGRVLARVAAEHAHTPGRAPSVAPAA